MDSDALALYRRAVLDGDLEAQYDLARLEEEEREAEYARIFWAEEERRREHQVRTRRRHLPSFNQLRPVGRERRPADNSRTRGSRRVGAGPSSSDDDPHEDGESDGAFSRPLSLGVG